MSPVISAVVPVFNEETNLPELVRRLREGLGKVSEDFEIVLVNDGSSDGSLQVIRALGQADPRLKCVNLSRNFGHQPAVTAGLVHARGDAVVVLDGDLQDPPEVIPELAEKWRGGAEVVYAVRRKRKENLLKRLAYAIFYRLLAMLSDIRIPLDSGDFCLMDGRVVRVLNSLPEKERFIRGLRAYVGFRQVGHEYDRDGRLSGESKYTFFGLMKLALNGIFSFSKKPLRIIGMGGLAVSLVGMIYLVVIVFLKLFVKPDMQEGFATLVSVTLFLGGGQLVAVWFLAEYIGHIFSEVKGRPPYVVRDLMNFDEAAGRAPAERTRERTGSS